MEGDTGWEVGDNWTVSLTSYSPAPNPNEMFHREAPHLGGGSFRLLC